MDESVLQDEAGPPPAATPSVASNTPAPPFGLRELIALAGIVVLADVSIYRGGGYSGFAALCAGLPLLLRFGMSRPHPVSDVRIVVCLIAAIAVRLVWCGSPLAAGISCVLGLMFAMALSGRRPFMPELCVFMGETNVFAYEGLADYRRRALQRLSSGPRSQRTTNILGVALPAAAVIVFGLLFLFANPDLYHRFGEEVAAIIRQVREWIGRLSLLEIGFCLCAAWLGVGFLRAKAASRDSSAAEDAAIEVDAQPVPDNLYNGFRNMLVAVTGLFAAYLVFEFQTLWFRVLPKGFYYAGYAHEGAFYLTVALGLATLILSAIFRARLLRDARLPALRRWGILWAIENLLLALAVYNRLFIYIDFNGMTRMRSVGLLGVSAVVAGCLLVMVKISRNRNSTWLIRRQLWVLAFAFYLYATLPIDAWVTRFNVGRVLAGDLAPSVQISEHPNSTEGLLELAPLLNVSDLTIRHGIRAMLAEEADRRRGAVPRTWTHFQLADRKFKEQLRGLETMLSVYPGPDDRQRDRDSFKSYAFQWY